MADLRGDCVTGLLSRALCPDGSGGDTGTLTGVLRLIECMMELPANSRQTLAVRLIDTLVDLRNLNCLQSAIGGCGQDDISRAFRILANVAVDPVRAIHLESLYNVNPQAVRDAGAWAIRQGANVQAVEQALSDPME